MMPAMPFSSSAIPFSPAGYGVYDASILVDAEFCYKGRDGSNSYLDSQMHEITQRFAEIQGNPFESAIEVL
jgi:hypothetical protein